MNTNIAESALTSVVISGALLFATALIRFGALQLAQMHLGA